MSRQRLFRLVTILVLVGLAVQVFAAKKDNLYRRYEELAKIVEKIEISYVEEVDEEQLFQGAIEGMLRRLDPYSTYIPKGAYGVFRDDTRGHFGGLGIIISIPQTGRTAGWLTVMAVLEGTPADRAGVRRDDVIGEIDGKSTRSLSLMEAVNVLRGEVGTKVTLTLYRRDSDEIKVTLTRQVIKIETVKGYNWNRQSKSWDYLVDKDNMIAYVRLAAFQEDSARDLEKALKELLDEKMKALVLDLRFNHGGLYPSAIDVSDLFLKEGVIVSTRGRSQTGETRSAHKQGTLPDFPLVVLINDASASASEIVAGALKDHNRGILIGTRSFGKGSVQNIIPIEGSEAALKLTTQHWYTPSGICVNTDEDRKAGLPPDIEVPLSDEELVALREHWREQAFGPLKQPIESEEDPQEKAPVKGPASREKSPFVDRQLDRAITYLKDVLLDRELRAAGS